MSPFSGAVTHAADVVPVAASGVFSLTWLLIALPLVGAAILLLAGRRTDKWGHWLGVLASFSSFVVAVILFFGLLGRADDSRTIRQHLFDWIAVGTFNAPADLRLDQLSMTFVLLITAALGAMVLAHRERHTPRPSQREQSEARVRSGYPQNLPGPGVYARHNAVGTPALLPDGTPTDLSVPEPLRGVSAVVGVDHEDTARVIALAAGRAVGPADEETES